jgi:hypothetical protein
MTKMKRGMELTSTIRGKSDRLSPRYAFDVYRTANRGRCVGVEALGHRRAEKRAGLVGKRIIRFPIRAGCENKGKNFHCSPR